MKGRRQGEGRKRKSIERQLLRSHELVEPHILRQSSLAVRKGGRLSYILIVTTNSPVSLLSLLPQHNCSCLASAPYSQAWFSSSTPRRSMRYKAQERPTLSCFYIPEEE
eukprot:2731567-Amphidinium_carterae.1